MCDFFYINGPENRLKHLTAAACMQSICKSYKYIYHHLGEVQIQLFISKATSYGVVPNVSPSIRPIDTYVSIVWVFVLVLFMFNMDVNYHDLNAKFSSSINIKNTFVCN